MGGAALCSTSYPGGAQTRRLIPVSGKRHSSHLRRKQVHGGWSEAGATLGIRELAHGTSAVAEQVAPAGWPPLATRRRHPVAAVIAGDWVTWLPSSTLRLERWPGSRASSPRVSATAAASLSSSSARSSVAGRGLPVAARTGWRPRPRDGTCRRWTHGGRLSPGPAGPSHRPSPLCSRLDVGRTADNRGAWPTAVAIRGAWAPRCVDALTGARKSLPGGTWSARQPAPASVGRQEQASGAGDPSPRHCARPRRRGDALRIGVEDIHVLPIAIG